MIVALSQSGLAIKTKARIPVSFRGQLIADYIADIIVEQSVILELKAVSSLDGNHERQLLNYLRATDHEIGLLMNFGPKPQVRRSIFDNPRKRERGELEVQSRRN
jgi:GxxExxY protein